MSEDRFEILLYRPYEKLIQITIQGKPFAVPENNMLLRCFQFLAPDTIPYGRYCWNEECQYCRVSAIKPDGMALPQVLSCKLMAEEGLEILELSAELKWNLHQLLNPDATEIPPPPPPAE
ncbi:MAG: hypothetical protein A3F68_02160 [Acidobacteria bacterium RIFCSPLOWO2_12_FULL_54_10]|nr:MAG: hypothetical protein A3F68_02160 [Acidobacteria bacterium RIFCSPLOWO2_12_FULL_54_10]